MSGASNAIIFVCQKGALEIESLLLASSILRFTNRTTELIAAVPEPKAVFGEPATHTLQELESLGVRIARFENKIANSRRELEIQHYIANKIFALQIPTSASCVALMDSDHLCHAPFDDLFVKSHVVRQTVTARPAGPVGRNAASGQWRRIFSLLGFPEEYPTPDDREPSTQRSPVYLNSGLLLVSSDSREQLGSAWEEAFRTLDRTLDPSANRYYIDQYALTAAIERSGFCWQDLDSSSIGGCFWHYFEPDNLLTSRYFDSWLREAIRTNRAIHHAIQRDRRWSAAISSVLECAAPPGEEP